MTPNIHYEKRELIGERLELRKGPLYWLGPDLTLRDCTLVISAARRAVSLVSGQFINCIIQAKGQLKTMPWAPIKLKGCRFKGRFTGNDFGFREDVDDRWRAGEVEDCDFSEAELHGCAFYNCDMRTVRLPRWPCFTFLNPLEHAAELRQHVWPGQVGRVTIEVVCESTQDTAAVTWHAPTVAEKMDTTVEELHAALERVSSVIM